MRTKIVLVILALATVGFDARSAYAGTVDSDGPVLTLKYRPPISFNTVSEPDVPANTAGLFYGDHDHPSVHHPCLAGVDNANNIYVVNAISQAYSRLERYDMNGKQTDSWQVFEGNTQVDVVCSSDHYIWAALDQSDDYSTGFPLLVYRPGRRAPLIDWRSGIDPKLEEQLCKVLSLSNDQFPLGWYVSDIQSVESYISIELWSEQFDHGGSELCIKLSSDGQTLIDAHIVRGVRTCRSLVSDEGFDRPYRIGADITIDSDMSCPSGPIFTIDPASLWSHLSVRYSPEGTYGSYIVKRFAIISLAMQQCQIGRAAC